jgi:hypothetical protein
VILSEHQVICWLLKWEQVLHQVCVVEVLKIAELGTG